MTDRLGEHERHTKARKKFAQIRGRVPRNPPYCVTDPDDWELIRDLGRGQLKCHQPGCSAQFQKPKVSKLGLRYLANMPGESCGHGFSCPDLGGGPMSPEHEWLQYRLAKIISRDLNHEAVVEHLESHADIYVTDAALAIEVQRWSTDFDTRTRARQRGEGKVLWLVTEHAQGKGTTKAMFRLPAARVAVVSRKDRRRSLQPWNHPEQESDAILQIYATVVQRSADGSLKTSPINPHPFLREVIEGRRRWYPPGTPGLPRSYNGAWVLTEDLEQVQEASRAAAERRRTERRALMRASAQQTVAPAPDPHPANEEDSPAPATGSTHSAVNQPAQEDEVPVEPLDLPDETNSQPPLEAEPPAVVPPERAVSPVRPSKWLENPVLPPDQQPPVVRNQSSAWQRFIRWISGR